MVYIVKKSKSCTDALRIKIENLSTEKKTLSTELTTVKEEKDLLLKTIAKLTENSKTICEFKEKLEAVNLNLNNQHEAALKSKKETSNLVSLSLQIFSSVVFVILRQASV